MDESGQVVDSTGPKEACRDAVEIFTTGIDLSQNYAARLVITQRHFTRQVLAVTDIREYASTMPAVTDIREYANTGINIGK